MNIQNNLCVLCLWHRTKLGAFDNHWNLYCKHLQMIKLKLAEMDFQLIE